MNKIKEKGDGVRLGITGIVGLIVMFTIRPSGAEYFSKLFFTVRVLTSIILWSVFLLNIVYLYKKDRVDTKVTKALEDMGTDRKASVRVLKTLTYTLIINIINIFMWGAGLGDNVVNILFGLQVFSLLNAIYNGYYGVTYLVKVNRILIKES